jgi:hypothetical protein
MLTRLPRRTVRRGLRAALTGRGWALLGLAAMVVMFWSGFR